MPQRHVLRANGRDGFVKIGVNYLKKAVAQGCELVPDFVTLNQPIHPTGLTT